MAGTHIGFAIASKDIVSDMNKIKFSFNPFNLNSVTMAVGIAAVKDTDYLKECVILLLKIVNGLRVNLKI